ncbi:hypothetical protein [Roseibium sp.]|uniref:type III secretion apparatus assembly protein SctX n=1 Tax=Roseibium sp. TaxID=1936156 RepID=UPI003264194D
MRIQRLDTGLESISRWRVDDEQHLPVEGKSAPKFLPKHRELDEILRRPSLDERLADLLEPAFIDPDLLEPSIMSETRMSVRHLMQTAAKDASGPAMAALDEAAALLGDEVELDQEVRSALAALLKG